MTIRQVPDPSAVAPTHQIRVALERFYTAVSESSQPFHWDKTILAALHAADAALQADADVSRAGD